ncbi:unnamed protein product [Chironomus riparius]|uniref:Exonuclease domain-containing protein n=1 Tax=Chironomus riparius TaxID=315576 RepID=A0A9N9RWJ0_9DIPT|nr:unnamed protein product [Chironomus riparius]
MADLKELTDEIEAVEKMINEQREKSMRKRLKKKKFKEQYKYILCIDFEATCFDIPSHKKRKIQEIIEFPAVLLNLETGEIESEFHRYVRPVESPILSDYCKNLTGISQETVDGATILQEVMEEFRVWVKQTIKDKDLIMPKTKKSNLDGNCCLMTWTNWDFLIQLRNECNRKQIKKPSIFNQWMDLKEIFLEKTLYKDSFSFGEALINQGMEFVGRPHSGIDDARMTAYLAHKLYKEGSYFRITKDMNHYSNFNRPF